MFIQNSDGYADNYVYVHFPAAANRQTDIHTAYWDGNDFVLAGRVKKDQLLNCSAYQFLAGPLHASSAASSSLGSDGGGNVSNKGGSSTIETWGEGDTHWSFDAKTIVVAEILAEICLQTISMQTAMKETGSSVHV